MTTVVQQQEQKTVKRATDKSETEAGLLQSLIAVEIEGVSPLLQHRFSDEEAMSKLKLRGGTVASTDYSVEYENYVYLNEKKEYCEPASHIEGCMTAAANTMQIAGQKGKRWRERAKAFIVVAPILIPIEPQEFHVDARPVVVNRGRVLRLRPCFPSWRLKFTVRNLDTQMLPDQKINEFLQLGGRSIGTGEYRPRFGRFMVTRFQILKEDA